MPRIQLPFAAPPAPATQHTYRSSAFGHDRDYSIVMPPESEAPAAGYPLYLLLGGFSDTHVTWFQNTYAVRCASEWKMAIVCPNGEKGWYTNGVGGSGPYEDDLIGDLLPAISARHPVSTHPSCRAVGGLSMGGYGAAKLALRYPELFSVGVVHSAALEVTSSPQQHPVFGDPVRDAAFRKAEDAFYLAEQAATRLPTDRRELWIDCGKHDHLIEGNRRFVGHLNLLGYPHTWVELPGEHTWPYWNRRIRQILPAVARRIHAEPAGV
ncbi:MAG: hypothetical protein KGJ62_09475 [Armatimonadetes bacterium]|nr:hypothetical protein [Armatimonadota bacterium]MDE2206565.1 hypothetical protein [Armatimonadota bacterium]